MMDKLVLKAFEKLQKREHLLRVLNDRLERGLITPEAFEKERADIYEVTQLTDEERRAYRQYISRYRKSK